MSLERAGIEGDCVEDPGAPGAGRGLADEADARRSARWSEHPDELPAPAAGGCVKGDRLADARQSQPGAALLEHARVAVVGEGVRDDRDDRWAGRSHLDSELGPVVVIVVDEEADGIEHRVPLEDDVRLPREVACRRRSHEHRRRAHGASADRVDEPVRLRWCADDEPSRLGVPLRGRAQPLERERHGIKPEAVGVGAGHAGSHSPSVALGTPCCGKRAVSASVGNTDSNDASDGEATRSSSANPRPAGQTSSGRSVFRASRKPRLTSSSSPSKRRSSCSIEIQRS